MKWFRSNIRLGSRLALSALAIQLLLSFGHFHFGSAQAEPALLRAFRFDHSVSSAAVDPGASGGAAQASTAGLVRLKTRSGHEPAGDPADHCAICAVMALANALVVATPPCLPEPQIAEFSYSTLDPGFVHRDAVRVAFQPRGPPVS